MSVAERLAALSLRNVSARSSPAWEAKLQPIDPDARGAALAEGTRGLKACMPCQPAAAGFRIRVVSRDAHGFPEEYAVLPLTEADDDA